MRSCVGQHWSSIRCSASYGCHRALAHSCATQNAAVPVAEPRVQQQTVGVVSRSLPHRPGGIGGTFLNSCCHVVGGDSSRRSVYCSAGDSWHECRSGGKTAPAAKREETWRQSVVGIDLRVNVAGKRSGRSAGRFSAACPTLIHRTRGGESAISGASRRRALSVEAVSPSPAETDRETEMAGNSKPVLHRIGQVRHVPGLAIKNLWLSVPLDYSAMDGDVITLFLREVVAVDKVDKVLPPLLYLQGGPGFASPRPIEASGWLKSACEVFRVFLMDQRGTGLSSPLSASVISKLGSPEEQVKYLAHFRADNIVRDAEFARKILTPGETWTVLGQSFGGFCIVSYLSMEHGGLRQALITGGLPPIREGCSAEAVYRALFNRVRRQNNKYYQRFPEDIETVQSIVCFLADSPTGSVPLPSGGVLSPRGLQLLGLSALGGHGGFEQLHYMLEQAWEVSPRTGEKQLSYVFIRQFENWLAFDTNPLYAVLHEAIYCQGAASHWAAERVRAEMGDEFDAVKAAREGRPVLFTGEMVFPWMFDEIAALRPLKDAANLIAEKEDWPPLYDKDVLAENKVPVAAIMYYDDQYVDLQLSEETASCISKIRTWVTSEYMHSGIREDGGRVLEKLLGMLSGKFPLR